MKQETKNFLYLSSIFIILMSSMFIIGYNNGLHNGRVRQCEDMGRQYVELQSYKITTRECLTQEEIEKYKYGGYYNEIRT